MHRAPGDETPEPWTDAYLAAHRRTVAGVLDDPELIERLAHGRELPEGYGVGLDERVIELPWLFAQGLAGRVLDAGSALNHRHVLERFRPSLESLLELTLAPEEHSFPELGVSYVYADVRELPFRDGYFDAVVCLSTLEHVGMDNARYGSHAERAEEPEGEADRALRELARVLVPGGALYLTVPYGRRENHRWFRQLDRTEFERLAAVLDPHDVSVSVFAYAAAGWQRSDLDAASDSRYHDHLRVGALATDRAAAARAVACLRLTP